MDKYQHTLMGTPLRSRTSCRFLEPVLRCTVAGLPPWWSGCPWSAFCKPADSSVSWTTACNYQHQGIRTGYRFSLDQLTAKEEKNILWLISVHIWKGKLLAFALCHTELQLSLPFCGCTTKALEVNAHPHDTRGEKLWTKVRCKMWHVKKCAVIKYQDL